MASKVPNFSCEHDALASNPEKKTINIMTMFRYPMVTYLTAVTFNELGNGLQKAASLLDKPITEDNLYELQGFYYLLQVLLANIKALNYCSINLNTLLPKDSDYKAFTVAFDGCVKKLAEESDQLSNKRTSQGSEEVNSLWK
jgi:hypothetical protein